MRSRDKDRLDWLSRNKFELFRVDCAQLYFGPYSFATKSPRQSIDAAMAQERRDSPKGKGK